MISAGSGAPPARLADPASIPPVVARPVGRLHTLDALRGLAAVAVMLFHYFTHYDFLFHHPFRPSAWFGHLDDAVLLFFMISGFVIPQSAARAASAGHFLAARFARLYPAYWIAMLLTFALVVSYPLHGYEGYAAGWKDVPANLTMFAPWMGYRPIDFSYWSLPFEVCFYVIIAVIFALRLGERLEAVSLLWLAGALVYCVHVGGRSVVAFVPAIPLDWYERLFIFQYASYFISGMMLYRVFVRSATPLTYATLAGAVACTYVYNGPTIRFYDYIFFVAALWGVRWLGWLANRPLLWLGSISYSLYLIHQYVGYTVIYSAYRIGLPSAVAIALAIGISLALAWLLRAAIEQPAEAAGKRSAYSMLDRWGNASRRPSRS